jgi:3-oxoacyl-[acyl-carrier protein] reductase
VELGLAGRVAIVTGASEGLGRGVAEALCAEGAAVVISARRPEVLEATAAALRASGGSVATLAADATDPDTPARLVESALSSFGRLDIVVPNAGGPPTGHALELSDAALVEALDTNFLSAVRLVRAALPHLRERGWGRICAIASRSVVQPMPTLALSNTSRVALWAWAKTAAHDLRGTGITANLVCPGSHRTARIVALGTPLGPNGAIGEPEDFGKIVAFVCSEPAAYLNGAAIVVDGGETLAL